MTTAQQKLVLAGVGFAAVGIAVVFLFRARRKKPGGGTNKATKNKQETSVDGGTKSSTTTTSTLTSQQQSDTKLPEKTTTNTQTTGGGGGAPANLVQPRAVGDESRIKGYWVADDKASPENYEFCDEGVFKLFHNGGYADGMYSLDPSSKRITVDLVFPRMHNESITLHFDYKFNTDNELILKTRNQATNSMQQLEYSRSEKPKIKVPEAVAHKSKEERYCIFVDKICELYVELENKIKTKANNEIMIESFQNLKKREEEVLAGLGLDREDIACISKSTNPKVKKFSEKLDVKTDHLTEVCKTSIQ